MSALHDRDALAWSLLRYLESVTDETNVTGELRGLVARMRAGDPLVLAVSAREDVDGAHVVNVAIPPGALATDALSPRLTCAPDGRWFTRSDGRVVRLDRSPTLQRLFGVLLTQRHELPGHGIPREELVARAWPHERCSRSSGANRLYFAIATLRELGLRPWLVRRAHGYLIDATAPLEMRDDPVTFAQAS